MPRRRYKRCPCCEELKPRTPEYWHLCANNEDGFQARCKVCNGTRTGRSAILLQFRFIKETTPCTDCGRLYPYFVMDFDHVPGRGEKIGDLSRMVSGTYSWESILLEIKKCDVVCANCHRIRTFDRGRGVAGGHGPLASLGSAV